jgi:soluble P-type ATPase
MIEIPNFKTLHIEHIVCDFNGTLATDGVLLPKVSEALRLLSEQYTLHAITSDTFGSVEEQLKEYDIGVKVLTSDNHTQEKARYVEQLGADRCVAIGNGNNDRDMLAVCAVGIAVIGDEGCAKDTLLSADVICKRMIDALMFFIEQKRLIATLRR